MNGGLTPGTETGLRVHQLTPLLKQLRLSGFLETLEVRHQQAVQEQLSYTLFSYYFCNISIDLMERSTWH